jgi:hypothetical protein
MLGLGMVTKFIQTMCSVRDLDYEEICDELSIIFDNSPQGVKCPVPGCPTTTNFKRWGDLRGHFLDGSTHKKDYFKYFEANMNEAYCPRVGPGFNHGLNALMLSLFKKPTNITGKSVTPVKKEVKAKPNVASFTNLVKGESGELFADIEANEEKVEIIADEPAPEELYAKNAFSQLSAHIRDSKELNESWRGPTWGSFVETFHGIPPCFHCRVKEGKQLHHQNPLFHEIILVELNKLGITANQVLDENLTDKLLDRVVTYHLKPGNVYAVPYCAECNRDAETKRRRGKKEEV